ncbi:MAG: HTH domain-containing protein [Bacteroidales bacterium]|nr:HTH domain-containing protein [Bacteroidales bacterium]
MSSQKIIELIRKNKGITTQEMADRLGISRRAVAKTIAKLQAEGSLRRIGPDKGGHWEIL